MVMIQDAPTNTWMVVERIAQYEVRLVSMHGTQEEAEAERDRRNSEVGTFRYTACMILEPIAAGMGRAAQSRKT